MGKRKKPTQTPREEEKPREPKSEETAGTSEVQAPSQVTEASTPSEEKEARRENPDIQFIKNLGYDTSQLEEITEPEKLKREIAGAKEKIIKIEEIKKQVGKYELPELENKIKLLKDKFGDFNAADEISQMFETLKEEWKTIKEQKLKEDLASIEVPGFEEDLLKIWKMFGTQSLEEIEKQVTLLKQRVKERFFEMQIVSSIVTAPERAGGQRVIKARPEEVFIMDLNGKILIRYVRKWRTGNKNVLAKLLSESYKLQKELNTPYTFATKKFDSSVYEIGLMKGTKFCMGIVATKELHAMTKQFLDKTLHLLEERYAPDSLPASGASMVLKALLNVYNKVSQISEDLNIEFEMLTETN
ncbi:MAG: hypothetical protein N3F63_02620 [Thermoplasmata archaeon]|nr:hypothetical protein [Thermoplasmata archaeon]